MITPRYSSTLGRKLLFSKRITSLFPDPTIYTPTEVGSIIQLKSQPWFRAIDATFVVISGEKILLTFVLGLIESISQVKNSGI